MLPESCGEEAALSFFPEHSWAGGGGVGGSLLPQTSLETGQDEGIRQGGGGGSLWMRGKDRPLGSQGDGGPGAGARDPLSPPSPETDRQTDRRGWAQKGQ